MNNSTNDITSMSEQLEKANARIEELSDMVDTITKANFIVCEETTKQKKRADIAELKLIELQHNIDTFDNGLIKFLKCSLEGEEDSRGRIKMSSLLSLIDYYLDKEKHDV